MLSCVIHLAQNEEITIIINKIRKTRFSKIFLVAPEGALLLKSPINLRILKDEIERRGIDFVLITQDIAAIALSKKIGIKCSSNIFPEKKEKENLTGKILEKEPPIKIARSQKKFFEDKKNNDSEKLSSAKPREWRILNLRLAGSLISAAIFASALFFASRFLPSANIAVLAKKNSAEETISVEIASNIENPDSGKIPCKFIETKENFSKDFPSTGEKTVQQHSKGKITIFNEWDSSPLSFKKGANVVSEDGKIFELQESVLIPGFSRIGGQDAPGKATAKIIASQPGSEYNISPQKFYFPSLIGSARYDTIYGRAAVALSGGAYQKEKVLSKEDIARVNQEIAVQFQQIKKENFNLKDSEIIIEDSIEKEILNLSFSAKEGEKTENFNVSAIISGKSAIVEKSYLENFIREVKGAEFSIESLEIESFEKKSNGGIITMRISGSDQKILNLSLDIKEKITGKSLEEAEKILGSLGIIDDISFKLWPFWVNKIPNNRNKINIFLDRNNYFSIIN